MGICENCSKSHDCAYGSGRFCSPKCARGFSTKSQRSEINKRVSKKLRKFHHDPHNDTTFLKAVALATSWSNLTTVHLGFVRMGNVVGHVRRRAAKLNADTSHFRKQKSIDDVLCYRPGTPKGHLRETLLRTGRVYICVGCGIGANWCDAPLTLQVDHINGDKDDHRQENLRFLCPNCHSQTSTWTWKNTKHMKNHAIQKLSRL